MTLDQLLECSADELEKMTDAQLLEHFKPFLDVTRPERARVAKSKTQHTPAVFMTPAKKKSLSVLAGLGIDIDLGGKRKR